MIPVRVSTTASGMQRTTERSFCGTCHVIVTDEWFGKTGEINDAEEQMLSMTPERARTSRLGCQIETTEAMDGMTVHLPEFQM